MIQAVLPWVPALVGGVLFIVLLIAIPAAVEYRRRVTGRPSLNVHYNQPPVRPPIPQQLRWKVLDRCHHQCVNCSAREDLEIDHRIPWSKGGPTEDWNLQVLCSRCNERKGAKYPWP